MSTHLGAAAPEQGRTLARRAEAGERARDSFREGGRAQGVVCDVTKKIGCDAVAAAALCCARTAAAVSLSPLSRRHHDATPPPPPRAMRPGGRRRLLPRHSGRPAAGDDRHRGARHPQPVAAQGQRLARPHVAAGGQLVCGAAVYAHEFARSEMRGGGARRATCGLGAAAALSAGLGRPRPRCGRGRRPLALGEKAAPPPGAPAPLRATKLRAARCAGPRRGLRAHRPPTARRIVAREDEPRMGHTRTRLELAGRRPCAATERKKTKNTLPTSLSSPGYFRCATPVRVGRPKTLEEIQNIVKTYTRAKAVGVGHSWWGAQVCGGGGRGKGGDSSTVAGAPGAASTAARSPPLLSPVLLGQGRPVGQPRAD